MALVKCPECGKEVSQHAAFCTQCGFPIENYVKNNLKECLQCNKLISKDTVVCEFCGCNLVEYQERKAKEEQERQIAEAIEAGKLKIFSWYGKSVYIESDVFEVQKELDELQEKRRKANYVFNEANKELDSFINRELDRF